MSKAGWVYTPSSSVKAAHSIPHVYPNGKAYTGDFDLNNPQPSPTATTGYFSTIFTTPIVFLALGLASILIFNVLLFFRCCPCCRCLKCAPSKENIEYHHSKIVQSRRIVWYAFLFWVMIVLLADHAIFFGNADVDLAIDNGATAFAQLAGVFTDIGNSVKDMSLQVSNFNTAVSYSNQACQTAFTSTTGQLPGPIDSVGSFVSGIPDKLDTFKTYLGQDAKDYKRNIIFVFYAVIMLLVILFPITAFLLRSKCAFYILITFAWLVVVALTIICPIIMLFIMVLGDFCMDPTRSLTSGLSPGSQAAQLITYYTTCVGDSPFDSPLNTIIDKLQSLRNTIGTQASKCGTQGTFTADPKWSSVYFPNADNALNQIVTDLKNIRDSVACGSGNNINMVWNSAMNKGICGNFFSGFFTIWVSEYVVSASLFCLMICASVLYQYFGPAWHLKPGSADDGEDHGAGHADVETPGGGMASIELPYATVVPSADGHVHPDSHHLQHGDHHQQHSGGKVHPHPDPGK